MYSCGIFYNGVTVWIMKKYGRDIVLVCIQNSAFVNEGSVNYQNVLWLLR